MRKIPTLGEMMCKYPEIALMERMKCESPCERTVLGVLIGVRAICRVLDLTDDIPITKLTRYKINLFLAKASKLGLSPVTAWGYVHSLRGIAARWTKPYYEELGWKVAPFDIPVKRRKAPRYVRPTKEKLQAVKKWYESLAIYEDGRYRIVAMLMLEFAMRNGDITRLSSANFVERNGQVFLSYVPHKTSLTSGRVVCWPVHESIVNELMNFVFPVKNPSHVFSKLNRDMRELGFKGCKGCYELRKICIDHVYQKFGAEMASSISGDDIQTVTRYYADPAQPNMGTVRIIDLI